MAARLESEAGLEVRARGLRVLLLSRYHRSGASSRLRTLQYIPYLEANGVECIVATLLPEQYLHRLYGFGRRSLAEVTWNYLKRILALWRVGAFDLVWIEKEILPWLPAEMELMLLAGVPYVVDYDDATFHTYDLHRHRAVRLIYGKKIDAVMRRAAAVVVGSTYLAERARVAGAKVVEQVPTVVDIGRYSTGPSATRYARFSVGWIGSPSSTRFLKEIEPALRSVCGVGNTSSSFVAVGSGPLGVSGVSCVLVPWSEDTEAELCRSFDVGVMPLTDSPWSRGKCGYKLVQYMAAGRPVVASPVGANQDIVQQGRTGFLARSTAEWIDALVTLRSDEALRRSMGRAARCLVEERYCLQVTAPKILAILRRAAAGGSS